jgi:hypothetical protein
MKRIRYIITPILVIVMAFLFGCDASSQNESHLHGALYSGYQTTTEDQYSYVMFTVKPYMPKHVTTKLLAYFISHEEVDYAPNAVCALRFSELVWNKPATPKEETTSGDVFLLGEIQYFKHFPIVAMLIRSDKKKEVAALLNSEFAFEVRPSMAQTYLGIIKALDEVMDQKEASFVNLSLQPPSPYPFNEKEAINVATRIASEHGKVIGIAVGNFGGIGNNTLSPWAVAPWVIGVGAAEANGTKLWKFSSRGIPNDPLYHPTIVAPGVDVELDVEGMHVRTSGTSIAVPAALGVALECWEFLEKLGELDSVAAWKTMATLNQGLDCKSPEPTPDFVIKMMKDMAVPMRSYSVYEVGAGFVDSKIAQQYFIEFGYRNFEKIFCNESIRARMAPN